MEQDYGDDFITISDEDGVEYELEVLSRIEYNGNTYLALTPADADENTEDLEVSILKTVEENGEELLVAVEDDDELEQVYGILTDQMFEDDSAQTGTDEEDEE